MIQINAFVFKNTFTYFFYMGCGASKTRKVHNQAFDLLDADGDCKVSKEEAEIVATYLHRYMINLSALEHNRLSTMKPIDYLYAVIDKRHGSDLKRTDFNKIAYMIPRNKWSGELLPVLRSAEISRLRNFDK